MDIKKKKAIVFIAFLAFIIPLGVIQSRRDVQSSETGADTHGQLSSEVTVEKHSGAARKQGRAGHETLRSFNVSSAGEFSTFQQINSKLALLNMNTLHEVVNSASSFVSYMQVAMKQSLRPMWETAAEDGQPTSKSSAQDIQANGMAQLDASVQQSSKSASQDMTAWNLHPGNWSLQPATWNPQHAQDMKKKKKNHDVHADVGVAFGLTGLPALDSLLNRSPYVSSFFIAAFKGCLADGIAQFSQKDQEGNPVPFKVLRNLAFIMYAGSYLGCMQYFVYNKLFPVWFAPGSEVMTILSKVMFDLFVLAPLVALPLAYLIRAVIFSGLKSMSLREALQEGMSSYTYDVESDQLLERYWVLWGPVQLLTLSILPVQLQVAFTAIVSFFWMIILSGIMGKDEQKVESGLWSVHKYVRSYFNDKMSATQGTQTHAVPPG